MTHRIELKKPVTFRAEVFSLICNYVNHEDAKNTNETGRADQRTKNVESEFGTTRYDIFIDNWPFKVDSPYLAFDI